MTPFLRKLGWWTRRTQNEAELDEELQFHFDEETEAQVAAGVSFDEARRAARGDLGSLSIVREDMRAAWTWTLLDQLAQDLRYGVRMLAANKTLSAMAILSLALGIGANTAIFSFMDAMLMRSLPVADPWSLVTLAWHTNQRQLNGMNRHDDSYTDAAGGFVGGFFAYPAFELFQRETTIFSTVFGYQGAGDLHVEVAGQAQRAVGEYVSGNYFTGLGVTPASGRLFGPDDDRAGAPAVAVISYALSEARFGGSSDAPGRSILLDHVPFTVVGVTPPEFFGADPNVVPAVYLPLHANLLLAGDKRARAAETYTDPNYDWVVPMARLRAGVSATQARAALGPTFSAWKAATDTTRPKNDLPTLMVKASAGGLDGLKRAYSKPLYLLLGIVGLILAVACANIANLLLARGAARTREIAVRLSMGASRARVVRQLLTESLLLSGIGGALGIVLAVWGIRALMLLLLGGRGDQPFALDVTVNWRVLGVVAALAVVTGVLFGLAPALRSTRIDLTPALKALRTIGPGARGRTSGLGRVLVVAQVAFTLLILVTAGLFLRTLVNLQSIPLGFNSEEVLTFGLNARQAGYDDPAITTFYDRLRHELAAIPGVRSVSLSDSPLLGAGWSGTLVETPAAPPNGTHALTVGPDFFSTMQMPLLRGRAIEERDRHGAPYVAVVNEEFAKTLLTGADPIGTHVRLPRWCAICDIEIVGVAGNARYGRLKTVAPATIFLSLSQAVMEPVASVTFELRTAGEPLALAGAVRAIVERADGRVPVTRMTSQRGLIESTFNQEIMFARLCTAFALLALAIASVGLYGTMAYGVARRTSEIGIRMALGAPRRAVLWMAVREVLMLATLGVAVSVPVALAASKLVESFLFGVTHNDPFALAAAVMTLVVATLVAAYVPARNASRIDPMAALRHE